MTLDPITFEVVKHRLWQIIRFVGDFIARGVRARVADGRHRSLWRSASGCGPYDHRMAGRMSAPRAEPMRSCGAVEQGMPYDPKAKPHQDCDGERRSRVDRRRSAIVRVLLERLGQRAT